ncbi:unnamed protein product [marine sediment metagenome]|uniref:Uncharacterized protein n=1 Tax=marine sediment metagenome TaxID=412755 RepID=X1MZ15_9ZZZZ
MTITVEWYSHENIPRRNTNNKRQDIPTNGKNNIPGGYPEIISYNISEFYCKSSKNEDTGNDNYYRVKTTNNKIEYPGKRNKKSS